jgi:septal ring factor EnvC (AmiA/AmiB activator)
MYLKSKKLFKLDKSIHSYHQDIEKYTHKYHATTDPKDKQKFHQKIEKLSQEYKKLIHQRHELLKELHSFSAGFARELQMEAQVKI